MLWEELKDFWDDPVGKFILVFLAGTIILMFAAVISENTSICKDANNKVNCVCVKEKAVESPDSDRLQKMLYTCSLLNTEQPHVE
jgi:hypothetical protein